MHGSLAGEPGPAVSPTPSVAHAFESASNFYEVGDYAGALRAADSGLAASPFYLPLWLVKAKAHFGAGEYGEAYKAISVYLTADAANPQANSLAIAIALGQPGAADAGKRTRLSEAIRTIGTDAFGEVLSRDILTRSDLALVLDDVLPAWNATAVGPKLARAVLRHYGRQEFTEGLRLLNTFEGSRSPKEPVGGLYFALGRAMAAAGHDSAALSALSRAKEMGYAPAEAIWLSGMVHLGQAKYARAADAWETIWRQGARPEQIVIAIADARFMADQPGKALAILEQALAAIPASPALQARRLLALYLAKKADEYARYEGELEIDDAFPGLGYGRALVARRAGDYERARNELDYVRDYIAETLGIALAPGEVEGWLESGTGAVGTAGLEAGAGSLAAGNRLWEEERFADAVIAWEDALLQGVPNSRAFVMGVGERLARQEKPRQAIAMLRRHIPEMTELDFAVSLAERKQWGAVHGVLNAMDPRGDKAPSWTALYRALAAVRQAERAEAVKSVESFAAMPVDRESLEARVVDPSGMMVFRSLERSDRQALIEELSQEIVALGYSELYPLMAGSPQWRPVPEDRKSLGPAENVGMVMLRTGQTAEARQFLENVLRADPGNGKANLFMAILEADAGRMRTAAGYVATGLGKAKGETREHLMAVEGRVTGDPDKEIAHLLKYLELAPTDNEVRLTAIRALVARYRYAEAARLQEYFRNLQARGDPDVPSFLALSNLELGDYAGAEEMWRLLVKRYPKSVNALSGLGTTLNLAGRPKEAEAALIDMAQDTGDAELCALMAEAALAQGNARGALKWVDKGLEGHPDDTRLLQFGADASDVLNRPADVERYALLYLAQDPYSAAVQGMYGQALLAQRKWDLLYCHNLELLDRNPRNLGALERETERVKACGTEKEAWTMDKLLSGSYANDPAILLRGAVTAAGAGDFRYAVPALECIMDLGINSAAISLYYPGVSVGDAVGMVPLSEVKAHLGTLSDNHYYMGLDALTNPCPDPSRDCPDPVPLVLIVGRSSREALLELDKYLEENKGRAVLVVGEESLGPGVPTWPNAEFLRRLAGTGRWEFLLTDYSPRLLPTECDGILTNFWTQTMWLGDRYENREEMRSRVASAMERLRNLAESDGIAVGGWVHPSWGDYGQRSIHSTQAACLAYRAAVQDNFRLAMTQTPVGYHIPGGDLLRVPMRAVGRGMRPAVLAAAIAQSHPTRRAVLELAKVKSWHTQFPEANHLFCMARDLGLDLKEIAYFQAQNSYYEGDVPTSIALAEEARMLDPEAERTYEVLLDTRRQLRPRISFEPGYWRDSDHNKYGELVANFGYYVREKWELRLTAGVHRWSDDDGHLSGRSFGAGVRYHFRPENWLQAEFRAVRLNDGWDRSYPEVKLQWHGAYDIHKLNANGTFNITYAHEAINTRRAQLAKIRANRFQIDTSTRVANDWDVDLTGYYISRTDGNDTFGMFFRPLFRVLEKPLLRVGYWFAAADSDYDPWEYYAPDGYIAHQVVGTIRYEICKNLYLDALASYGVARSKDTDWRESIRLNGGLSWRVNDCLDASISYQYFKLPDYSLHQYYLYVGYRF